MLPELGQIALILALLVAALQALLPLAGAHRNKAAWMDVARPAAYAQLWLVMLAFIALTVAFVQQDFSVNYVADNPNSLLPLVYRYTARRVPHEGSLLLWALLQPLCTAPVSLVSARPADVLRARALGVFDRPQRDPQGARDQVKVGLGAGASYFIEVGAFSGFTFFAGQIGAAETAAWARARVSWRCSPVTDRPA